MAKKSKKATQKQSTEDSATKEQAGEVRLSWRVYAKAVYVLIRNWVRRQKRLVLFAGIILVFLVAGLIYALRTGVGEVSNNDMIIQISRELSISGDGNPAILTVVDKDQATQPFLEQAKNGDKVVLYYKAKKAVLYRPSERRIVHQGAYVPPDAKIFIRKSTDNNVLVDTVKEQLKNVQSIKVVSEDVAANKNYQGVTLVNVTDRYDEKIAELEKIFNTKARRMPQGESIPDADILIIVGSE